MTKINTVTTRQLGEMSIAGPFRLSAHSGPLYVQHYFLEIVIPCMALNSSTGLP
jgi:hypothetical protein